MRMPMSGSRASVAAAGVLALLLALVLSLACSGGSAPSSPRAAAPHDGAPSLAAEPPAPPAHPITPPAAAEPSPAAAEPAPAEPPPREEGAVALTESMARPYFAGPAAAPAARFALEDWRGAQD